MGDGVIFVAMALRTGHRNAHPDSHCCIDTIDDSDVSEFFVVGPTFVIGKGVAMECGSDELVRSGVWEEVTGELFDGELIEWHVCVVGTDDPIAIGPDGAWWIVCVSGGVSIASEV